MGIRKWTVPLVKLWLCFVLAASVGAMIDGISVKAKYAKNIYGDDRQEEFSMEREVSLNGVSLYGLTQEEAIEQVTESYHWYMTVYYGKHPQRVKNLMEVWVRDAWKPFMTGRRSCRNTILRKLRNRKRSVSRKNGRVKRQSPAYPVMMQRAGNFFLKKVPLERVWILKSWPMRFLRLWKAETIRPG